MSVELIYFMVVYGALELFGAECGWNLNLIIGSGAIFVVVFIDFDFNCYEHVSQILHLTA